MEEVVGAHELILVREIDGDKSPTYPQINYETLALDYGMDFCYRRPPKPAATKISNHIRPKYLESAHYMSLNKF